MPVTWTLLSRTTQSLGIVPPISLVLCSSKFTLCWLSENVDLGLLNICPLLAGTMLISVSRGQRRDVARRLGFCVLTQPTPAARGDSPGQAPAMHGGQQHPAASPSSGIPLKWSGNKLLLVRCFPVDSVPWDP